MKNLNRFHLNGLRAVEAVGRLGSLSAAADELGVTPGAISQHIQKAEEQLGRALFDRSGRGLHLTPLGSDVMPHFTAAMKELSAGVAMLTESRDDPLVVSVPPVFASKRLVWRLSAFNETYPTIKVRVDASMDMVDMATSDVDVCVRVKRRESPLDPGGARSSKLMDQYIYPVCSLALAERLASPADLKDVPIVRDRLAMFNWNEWFLDGELTDDDLTTGLTFSDASLCLDSTIAGQGVFLAWETLACDALAAGRLAEPFRRRAKTGISYWLLERRHSLKARSIDRFTGWLKEELSQSLGRPVG